MCAAMKEMTADHSGTGVFYQAVPAVGADGKKMMKLIPVQIVNGQSFRHIKPTPQKAAKRIVASSTAETQEKASFTQSSIQDVIRKQITFVNTLPKQAGLNAHKSPDKHPQTPQTVNLLAKKSPVETPATNDEKFGRSSSQFSVTVKSPALPKGHYLQIPPDAEVRTVPASELPVGIKNQIFTSSVSSSSGSGVPSVVYVSPITTMSQGVSPPRLSAPHSVKQLPKATNETSPGPPRKGLKPFLKLIKKSSQRPNSPIRWMIEEEENTVVPALDVLNSPSVTSEILSAVAEREKASKQPDDIAKPASESSKGKTGQGRENALVMCNGKVFFVAKKGKLPLSMGEENPPTTATSYEFNKTKAPSSPKSPESVSPEVRQRDHTIIISDELDEVIDLCDDDAQDGASQPAASVDVSAVPHQDEDNVIFVSYIPPKTECESTQEQETHREHLKEAEQVSPNSSSSVTEQKSLNGTTGKDGTDETVGGKKPDRRVPGDTVKTPHGGGSAVVNLHENNQQITSTQHLKKKNDTHRLENSQNPAASCTSSLATESCHMADYLLRQIFRITADVKICLWRIDEKESDFVGDSVKILKAVTGEEPSADPHTRVGPLKCSHFQLNPKPLSALKCHSGQNSLQRTSCDESEPVIGYVEPIDEDFLNTDENDITDSCSAHAWPQTPTWVDLNTSTRRVGRARKRTICPCCVPGTQGPGKKSRTK